jgi:hypothetical protein
VSEPSPQPAAEMTLNIRTANRDRKAEIAVDLNIRVSEILEAAMQNWALSADYDYVVRCDRLGTQLRPSATLVGSGIREGDTLEIQPIADAGTVPVVATGRPGRVLVWLDAREPARLAERTPTVEVRPWA